MARWLGAIAILSVFLFVFCKSSEEQDKLSFVPEGMGVSKILYVKEESWGPGPGGNETGVILYELPDSVAEEIQSVGVKYFAKLPQKLRELGEWRGHYERWQHTPIRIDQHWADHEVISTKSTPKIADYLNRYGFGISIDPLIERDINKAISRPGSFFAYGRIGILIVIPDIRRVIYAYNG